MTIQSRSYPFFILLLILTLVFTPTFVYADEVSDSGVSSDAVSQDSGLEPAKLEVQDMGDGKISMDFRDALLPDVLKVLSSLSGTNFVTAEDAAAKKVNIFLENVSFEDALAAIVKGNGLVAQKVGEQNIYMIRVGTGEDALIPLETKVFKLKYIRVAKAKEVAISEGSGSSGSSGSSSSSVGGSTSITAAAALSGGEPTEIKDTIEDLLSPRGKVTVNDRTNSVIITDTQERLEQIEKVITELDHPLNQVLIEAIMLETAADFDKYLGTDWGTGSGSANSLGSISGARGSFNIPFLNQAGDIFDRGSLLDENTGLSFGSFDFSQMTATLRALQTDNRTKILAKPKILVLDNEPAFVKITVNAVVAQNSSTIAGGGTGTNISSTSTERTEIGVTLKVTPLINDDNTITLTIEPRFSTLETAQFDSDLLDPRIRASRTTLSIKDGEVITMGGLMQRQDEKVKRKVPILGDVPLFGVFFTKWTTEKLDRELVLFLRPQIVRNGNSELIRAKSIPDKISTADEEAIEFWKIWKKPWFKERIAKSPFSDQAISDDGAAHFFDGRDQAMNESLAFHDLELGRTKNSKTPPDSKTPISTPAPVKPA